LRRLSAGFWLIILTVIFFPAAAVMARAGGGGGFHDGGGGGGGGGSIGGLIELIYLLIRLVIVYPLIGLPTVVLIVVFIIWANRQGQSAYQSSVLRRGGGVIEQERKAAILQRLRAHDFAFDEGAFCKRVGGAFLKIQTAWCAQELKGVQLFLSDGVVERFSLQFAEQREQNYHDQMQSIAVQDVQIVDLDSSGVFDEISLRIAARAVDYRADLSSGQRVSGSTEVEPFVEVWSFLRRRGAVTDPARPGLIEGHCPNCGAAIAMNQSAQCPYCRALLHSGRYDWVLCEITQQSQWERSSDRSIRGLEQLKEADDGFSPQALEDRASVIFWRKAAAGRLGKVDPLRKVAVDSFCDQYGLSLKTPRRYAGDCAVGGVHMVGFVAAGAAEPMDRVLVQIRWSATLITLDASGRRNAGGDSLQTSLLVLGRQRGARTDADTSISSAHCPKCGAPESQSIENACAACGTVLNDGSRDWVLLQWLSTADPAAQALLPANLAVEPSARAPSNLAGLLAWAVKMSCADGRLDPAERKLLEQFAAHDSVSAEQLDRMIAAGLSGELQVPAPATPAEAREWLTAISRIALSDGTLDPREVQLLKSLGSRASLSEYDVGLLVKRVQAEQYAAARSSVRF
jgi:hypothetical protein